MAGKSGNQGNRPGGVGAVGGSADFVPVLPDRVDLPFVTATIDDQADKTKTIPISTQKIDIKKFPDNRWSADWLAWYALSDYVQTTNWKGIAPDPWTDPTLPQNPKDPKSDSEVEELLTAARDERADALGEIVAQHESFADYFFALLTIDPATYPKTNLLVSIASIVAAFTVLHYKYGVKGGSKPYEARPRPSQVCPALLPPVPVPGHPSYPSGHATEAHLIELVLNDVLKGSLQETAAAIDLAALASRIARNREIAGLHYLSDSKAGKKLASDIYGLLQGWNFYTDAIAQARREWPQKPPKSSK